MAAVDSTNLSKQEHDELCCVYATLALHDAGLEVTVQRTTNFQEERIAKLIKTSGNTVEPYQPSVFAKALQGENISTVIENLGAAPAAAGKAEEHAELEGMGKFEILCSPKEGWQEGDQEGEEGREGGEEGREKGGRSWRLC